MVTRIEQPSASRHACVEPVTLPRGFEAGGVVDEGVGPDAGCSRQRLAAPGLLDPQLTGLGGCGLVE